MTQEITIKNITKLLKEIRDPYNISEYVSGYNDAIEDCIKIIKESCKEENND